MEHKNLINRIDKYLKTCLKDKRYRHTLSVRDLALEMAEREGVDLRNTELAALLHDMARNIDDIELKTYVKNLCLDERYADNINLAHSKIARELAEIEFGIDDEDILNAISYHTTGRAGMSTLEKIIFLADAIEPGRTYLGVDNIRQKARTSIDEGCLASLQNTISYVKSKNEYLDSDTQDAYKDIKEKK
ncbi:MAG: bis(5'-nucleosyl)-tetraphosphatase (symmetrical) YqeK [Eubacteriales bacterium]|nr:bis(5'-nucleosyl)-tetraphosphatase (symmetrical) YqeK [Eubacteriales bacterium]